MKRFYKSVEAIATSGDYWEIQLDGRAVKTPLKKALRLPTAALAKSVACEWDSQTESIEPSTMPFSGYANAAIDRIGPERGAAIAEITRYLSTDLLCYEADEQPALQAKQKEVWAPYRDWFAGRFGADLKVASGIMPVRQEQSLLDAAAIYIERYDDFELTALKEIANLTGSAVLAFAYFAGVRDETAIWMAADIDRLHQASLWGEDPEAEAFMAKKRQDFDDVCHFLRLVAR